MAHLIEALKNTSIGEALRVVRSAKEHLNICIVNAVDTLKAEMNEGGAIRGKRCNVIIADSPLEYIDRENRTHRVFTKDGKTAERFVEVLNQAATLHRLEAALAYADCNAELSAFHVHRCHPTTSSDKCNGAEDNDLMLADDGGVRACFEVSDVVREANNNSKLQKDLTSLRLVDSVTASKKTTYSKPNATSPDRKRFLVVSKELFSIVKEKTCLQDIRKWVDMDTPPTIGLYDTYIVEVKLK